MAPTIITIELNETERKFLEGKPTRTLYCVEYSNGCGGWGSYKDAVKNAEFFGRWKIYAKKFLA